MHFVKTIFAYGDGLSQIIRVSAPTGALLLLNCFELLSLPFLQCPGLGLFMKLIKKEEKEEQENITDFMRGQGCQVCETKGADRHVLVGRGGIESYRTVRLETRKMCQKGLNKQ